MHICMFVCVSYYAICIPAATRARAAFNKSTVLSRNLCWTCVPIFEVLQNDTNNDDNNNDNDSDNDTNTNDNQRVIN